MQALHGSTNTSVRIQVDLLDSLMNLAGELVLGRNQLLQAVNCEDKRLLETTSQRINMVTSEIQEQIMRTRMQPMGTPLDQLPRIVEDLARQAGKQIDLSIAGKDVEIDKSIMEAIEQPLTWIVQQAVNHGIESPEDRETLNKPGQGIIEIKASHQTGLVNIDIIDDGKGIDPDTIVRQAVENGLISDIQALECVSETEKMNLAFLPGLFADQDAADGFSQFAGIDEVKSGLERIGGTLEVSSKFEQGTHVRFKLPLTLSIIPSQIIKLADEQFAIPQVNLRELLRIPADQVKHVVEKVGSASVIRLRGEILPLIDLAEVLGVSRGFIHPGEGLQHPERCLDQDRRCHADNVLNVAVVSTGKYEYGLVVDALNDSEEIVVKPLGKHMKSCHGFAGATIISDGKVALILDVASIGEMSKLRSESSHKQPESIPDPADHRKNESAVMQTYLFFNGAETERFAVPLKTVERIEKIKAADIETVGGNRVLKYRGGTLPLLTLDEAISAEPLPEKSHCLAICFKVNGREIGILSTPPIDAVDVEITLDTKTIKQAGVLGSAVLMDKTTLILDVQQIVKNCKPDFFNEV